MMVISAAFVILNCYLALSDAQNDTFGGGLDDLFGFNATFDLNDTMFISTSYHPSEEPTAPVPTGVPTFRPSLSPTYAPTEVNYRDIEIEIVIYGSFKRKKLTKIYVAATIQSAINETLLDGDYFFANLTVDTVTISSNSIISTLYLFNTTLTADVLINYLEETLEDALQKADIEERFDTITSVTGSTEISEEETKRNKAEIRIEIELIIIIVISSSLAGFCILCGIIDYFCVNKVSNETKIHLNPEYHETRRELDDIPNSSKLKQLTHSNTHDLDSLNNPDEEILRINSNSMGALGVLSTSNSIPNSTRNSVGVSNITKPADDIANDTDDPGDITDGDDIVDITHDDSNRPVTPLPEEV